MQDLAHGQRFAAARSLLGAAEQRRDATPDHVVDRRFIGEPLRQVDRAVGCREARHAADDRLLELRYLLHASNLPCRNRSLPRLRTRT